MAWAAACLQHTAAMGKSHYSSANMCILGGKMGKKTKHIVEGHICISLSSELLTVRAADMPTSLNKLLCTTQEDEKQSHEKELPQSSKTHHINYLYSGHFVTSVLLALTYKTKSKGNPVQVHPKQSLQTLCSAYAHLSFSCSGPKKRK